MASASYYSEKRELRIMLVGKTGIGKSAVGNAILGRNAFESRPSLSSVTKECKKETAEFHGQKLAVVDTPGLFDTHRSVADVVKKIMECISLLSPGPHAILVMLQLNRFTKEEQETVKIIQEMFGNEAQKHTMVLFTHGDMLKGGNDTIEELISDNDQVKDFIRQCHGGYHVLDCKDNNQAQISELLQKINRMVQRNGDFYTNKMFQEAEKSNKEEMETIQRGNPWMDPQEARRRAERNNMLIRVVSTTPAQVFIRARAGSGSGAEFGAEFGAGGAQTSGVFRTIIEAVQRLARFVRNKLCITQ